MKRSSAQSKSIATLCNISEITSNENDAFAAHTFILLQPSGKTAAFVNDVTGIDGLQSDLNVSSIIDHEITFPLLMNLHLDFLAAVFKNAFCIFFNW